MICRSRECRRSCSTCAITPAACSTARSMCSAQFLPPNTKVVSTQGRAASQQHDYSTPGGVKERPRFPLVGAGERRKRERLGDRRRRAQGFASRDCGRRDHFRQRLGAKRDAVARWLGPAFHDGEILHPEQSRSSRATASCPTFSCRSRPEQERAVAALRNNDKIQPAEATGDHQDERPANDARDRRAQRRDDLRAADRAEGRRGEEVAGSRSEGLESSSKSTAELVLNIPASNMDSWDFDRFES